MAQIGLSWDQDSWDIDAWAADTWADGPPERTLVRGLQIMSMIPYNKARELTPGDTSASDIPLTNGIYVGGAGVVVAVFQDNTTAAFTAVAGEILPIKVKRINSTNTTATLMVALYHV